MGSFFPFVKKWVILFARRSLINCLNDIGSQFARL